ncbi:phosphatase PAP2 family protein [Winogradskyella sp. A3E31]|uniref:phosphatase PAP2 family protein n=1 Tax=Winogradskyella sp. A3E31 TaxID=3349637 RepID=UPI00398B45DF
MLDWLLENDTELFLFLNNLGSESWDQFWLIVTHEYTFAPLYGLLLFLIYKKYGLKPLILMVFVIAAMITFTDQMTNVFKDTFMRPRPCRAEGIMDQVRFIAVRCGKYGFFSGHSSNSMAAAIFGGLVLRTYFKGIIYYLIFWSFVVAYSRIYVGVHYPLDIICGLTFGALSGLMFYKLNKYLLKRFISD